MVFTGWQSHHYLAGGCQRLLEGWFVVILVFSLYRRRVVGRGRSPEVTPEGPVKHAFGKIINDWPWNTVKNLIWDASHWVRTRHPNRGGVYRILVPMHIRTGDWTCHTSNGGVLCEAAMCSFRCGPYMFHCFKCKSHKKFLNHNAWLIAAINSTSVVNCATVSCFLEHHEKNP